MAMNRINRNLKVKIDEQRLTVLFRRSFFSWKALLIIVITAAALLYFEQRDLMLASLVVFCAMILSVVLQMINWFFYRRLVIDLASNDLVVKRMFLFVPVASLAEITNVTSKSFHIKHDVGSDKYFLELSDNQLPALSVGRKKNLLVLEPYLNDFISIKDQDVY